LKSAFICVYLRPLLRGWRYHNYLESVTIAGSHAKGTDLKDSDVDIFLRLSPDTPGPLSAMQASLADHVHGNIRNVSVRIMLEGRFIDLVPARRSFTCDVLWQARFNTWLKTDTPSRSATSVTADSSTKSWHSKSGAAATLFDSPHS